MKRVLRPVVASFTPDSSTRGHLVVEHIDPAYSLAFADLMATLRLLPVRPLILRDLDIFDQACPRPLQKQS